MGEEGMKAPAWKWEWNLNTVMQLITLASIIFGGGWVLAAQQAFVAETRKDLDALSTRVATVETLVRTLDKQEYRVTGLEQTVADTTSTLKSLEGGVNSLTTDVKVVKEILQRLEGRSH